MATLEELLAQAENESQLAEPSSQMGGLSPRERAVVAAGGSALNIGDMLTAGLLSKGLAAGPAIYKDIAGYFGGEAPQDYYAQELAKVQAVKDIGEEATQQAGLARWSEGLGFVAPFPGGKAETLFNIRKPLAEAGLGLASYFGSELGQYATNESPYGSAAGAILAPGLTQLAAGGGRRLASAIGEPISLLRGGEEAIAKEASKEILERAGTEGAARLAIAQQLETPLMSPLGMPMTAAEVAQTPGLAAYQYLMSEPERGGQILTDALTARREAQRLALGELGTQPQKGELAEAIRLTAAEQGALKAEEATKAIDLDIASMTPAAIEEPSKLVKTLGADLVASIRSAGEEAKTAGRVAFKNPEVYNVNVDVSNIGKDISGLVKSWRRDPSQRIGDNRVIRAIKDLKGLDVKDAEFLGVKPQAPIGKLHDIQVELGKVLAKGKANERTPEQALALSIYKYIDGVVEKAPGSEKLFEAKAKWKNYFDNFVYDRERGVQSPLKAALKKSPEKVVPSLAKESASVEALQKAGIGTKQIETLKLSEFMNLKTPQDKLKWIEKNRPALSGADFWQRIENAASTLKTTQAPTKLAEYAKIEEGAIPRQVFSDASRARKFMQEAQGTRLPDLARGKFVEMLQTGKGTMADRLAAQKKVAKIIFEDTYPQLEKVVADIEGAALPERLKQLATGKQSITGQKRTTAGAIADRRTLLKFAQNSTLISTMVGGLVGGITGAGAIGAMIGAGVGGLAATGVGRKGKAVEDELNRVINKMLADPKLIDMSAAPPTKKNVEEWFKQAARLGYFGSKATQTTDADELEAQQLLNSL